MDKSLRLLKFLPVLIIFFLFPLKISADFEENSFITIVNPVRISHTTKNPKESLLAEYNEVKKFSFPATWLFTYDALKNKEIVELTKSMDNKQEFGIFLEVSPDFAQASSVSYNLADSWHRATSIFLSGYTQEDRIKLINKVMEDFKSLFGYYPKSVGSWWTDAFSLKYLEEKYGVIANLSVSDQFSLDEYRVWGTYWSIPYYPSKINASLPAKDLEEKIDILMLRWAARDPVNGYESPTEASSGMYSLQDFASIGLPFSYFEKLLSFYALRKDNNQFGHVTIGFEGDMPSNFYSGHYAQMLETVSNLNHIKILTMRDFANWYKNEFKGISPPQIIIADDFLDTGKKGIWFQNPNYRIGLLYDSKKKRLTVNDFRIYHKDFEEPFLKAVNRQNGLFISLPYVIDSIIKPDTKWVLPCGDLPAGRQDFVSSNKEKEVFLLNFKSCQIKFLDRSVELEGNIEPPQNLNLNSSINVKKKNNILSLSMEEKWIVPPEGITLNVQNLRIPFGLKRRFPNLPGFALVCFLIALALLLKVFKKKTIIFIPVLFLLIALFFKQKLYISQSEFEALMFLKDMPVGNVLVLDKDCSRCVFHSEFKPAAAAGYKKYIEKYGQKKIVQSLNFSLADSPEKIDREIKQARAKYIYFAKYEDYIEILSYPPENISNKLKKVFENANAQIWQII